MSYADIVRGAFGGDRFTIISNLAARDRRLHYKARGLLTARAGGSPPSAWPPKPPTALLLSGPGLKNWSSAGTCVATVCVMRTANSVGPGGSSLMTPPASKLGSLSCPHRSAMRVWSCSSGKTPGQSLSAISLRWITHRWIIA